MVPLEGSAEAAGCTFRLELVAVGEPWVRALSSTVVLLLTLGAHMEKLSYPEPLLTGSSESLSPQ